MAETNLTTMDKAKTYKLGALVFALLFPALLDLTPLPYEYVLHVAIMTLLYMILALGLNIVPGFNGLLDLGYVGFYGIGAYTSGLLTVHYGLSFWLIIPLAFVNGAIWGVLLGAPTLRLTGDYFAIVTFGFSELVVLFLTNEVWLTRGPLGLPGIDPASIDLELFGGPVILAGGRHPPGLLSHFGHGAHNPFRDVPHPKLAPGPGLVRHPR